MVRHEYLTFYSITALHAPPSNMEVLHFGKVGTYRSYVVITPSTKDPLSEKAFDQNRGILKLRFFPS